MNFSRKAQLKSNLVASTLIVLGIIIVINIIGFKWFMRFDLTQNNDFSLSKVTKKTLSDLDDIVNIKVYFSEDLPSQYINTSQETKDILDEYQNLSKNKIKVSYIDPKDDTELQSEARRMNVPQIRFNVIEKDQYQISNGYLGLAVIYGDKKEAIPVIEDTRNLEYKLTSSIKKVTADKIGVIGFTKGHDEPTAEELAPGQQNYLKEILRQQYNTRSVDTTLGEPISEDIDTLVINGPKSEFSRRELFVIDQFLMSGKSILFLLDGVTIGDNLSANINNTNLKNLIANYGVNFENNLVLDVSNDLVSFNDGQTFFMSAYPFWVRALRENFDLNNTIVNQIESLLFPWVSTLTLNMDIIGGNEHSELVKSTAKSWIQNDNFSLDPTQQFSPQSNEFKQSTLAVSIKGKFNSYFKGKPAPSKDAEETEETKISSESVIESTDSGRIIVIGDSDFISEQTIQRSKWNLTFFQNVIDSLTQDENLSSIRAKGATDRPIKNVEESQKTLIKFVNIFGVTILIIIIGIVRFMARRKDDKREF